MEDVLCKWCLFKPSFLAYNMCSMFQNIQRMPSVFDQKTDILATPKLHQHPSQNKHKPSHLFSTSHSPNRAHGPPRFHASACGSRRRPRGGLGAAHRLRGLPGRQRQERSGNPKVGRGSDWRPRVLVLEEGVERGVLNLHAWRG